jgi:lysophospholipase L1-like esterase
LQRRDGFTVFHATHFRARRDEFKGWSDQKCSRLVHDLAVAIRDELTEGVTIALPRSLYEKEYRGGYVPKKMSLDSQFGVCFHACMDRLIHILRSMKKRHRLNVVIEHGHPNAEGAVTIFKEIKARLAEAGIDILGTGDCCAEKRLLAFDDCGFPGTRLAP